MTDTITKIRVLADDFADSGRTYEGCDVARALNGFADRCEATNPTRSDESELRLAAEEVVGFAGFMTVLTPEKERREIPTTFNTMLGTFGELLANLAAALSQTPEAGTGNGTHVHTFPDSDVHDETGGYCMDCGQWVNWSDLPPSGDNEAATNPSETPSNLNQKSEVQEGLGLTADYVDRQFFKAYQTVATMDGATFKGEKWLNRDEVLDYLDGLFQFGKESSPPTPEEGVRLTGEFVAKRNPDGEIEHHFNSEGDADVLFAATPEAIPLAGPVEILIRPLSEVESNG